MALLVTLLAGIFFLIGASIAIFGKKKKGLVDFSLGLSFSVLVLLVTFDIVPEVLELLTGKKKIFMYIFIVMGIILLKLLDILVPHHNHNEEIKTHDRHLKHIGVVSTISLILHNVVEGIAIYSIATNDLKAGLLMSIAVGLHNIPFGIEITATLNESKKKKKHVLLYILLLTLSTVLGAFIIMIFKDIPPFVEGSLLSLTIGMIIYLALFELLGELLSIKDKKYSKIGLIIGILLMVVVMIIGG